MGGQGKSVVGKGGSAASAHRLSLGPVQKALSSSLRADDWIRSSKVRTDLLTK